MKKYIRVIIFCSLLLLLFPFLGLPELWEHLYVVVLAFCIGTTTLLLRHKSGLVREDEEEKSLENYVTELKNKFKEQSGSHRQQANSHEEDSSSESAHD